MAGDDECYFSINSSTGIVSLSRELDSDVGPSLFNLTISVSDGTHSSNFSHIISISDVNDNPPIPVSQRFFGNVLEEQPILTLVDFPTGDIAFIDADSNDNAELTFSLDPDQSGFVLLDRSSTSVFTNRTFDYDAGDREFSFNITATDGGSPANSAMAFVTIAVIDTNDIRPLIDTTLVEGAVFVEESNTPVRVADVVVSDIDLSPLYFASVGITAPQGQDEELSAMFDPALCAGVVYADGVLLIVGRVAASEYGQILSTTTYINRADELSLPLQRNIEFSVCDQLNNDTLPAGLSSYTDDILQGVCGNSSLSPSPADIAILMSSCDTLVSSSVDLPLEEVNDRPYIPPGVVVDLPSIPEDIGDDENKGELVALTFGDIIIDPDRDSFVGIAVVGHGSPAEAQASSPAGGPDCVDLRRAYLETSCRNSINQDCGCTTGLYCSIGNTKVAFVCLVGTTAKSCFCNRIGRRKKRQVDESEIVQVLGYYNFGPPIDLTDVYFNESASLDLDFGVMNAELYRNFICGNGTWVFIGENNTILNETTAPRFPIDYISLNETSPEHATLLGPLSFVRFVPFEHATGEAEIFFKAWDGSNNLTVGEGWVDTTNPNDTSFSNNTGRAVIEILPVNDPPEMYLGGPDIPNYSTNYTENAAPVYVSARNALILEQDEDDLLLNTLQVNVSKEDGSCDLPEYQEGSNDVLLWLDIPQVQPVSNQTAGEACMSYVFGGQQGVNFWENFIRMMRFQARNDEPSTHRRRLAFTINDAESTSEAAFTYIDVSLVSDNCPEIASSTSMPLEYVEHVSGAAIVDAGITVVDNDLDAVLRGAEVEIPSGTCEFCELTANYVPSGFAAPSFSAGKLTITGQATPLVYQEILRNVTFADLGLEPSFSIISIRFSLFDDTLSSLECSDSFTERIAVVQHINDNAPEVFLNYPNFNRTFFATYTEGDANTPLTGTLPGSVLIVDRDGLVSEMYRIEVSISTGCVPGEDVLEFIDPQPSTLQAGYNPSTCSLILNGSKPALEGDLLRLRYQNANQDNPSSHERMVTFTIFDDPLGSTISVTVLTVEPVNDRPFIDLDVLETGSSDSSVTFRIGVDSVGITGENGGLILDPDDTDLEGMELVLAEYEVDDLGQRTQVSPRSDEFHESIETQTTGLAGTFQLTLTLDRSTALLRVDIAGTATVQNYITILNDLVYSNPRIPPTTNLREITVRVNDGQNFSEPAVAVITFQGGTTPPRVDLNGNAAGVNTEATYTTTLSPVQIAPNAFVSDVDGDPICSLNVTLSGPRSTCTTNSLMFDTSGFSDIQRDVVEQADSSVFILVASDCRDAIVFQRVIQDITFMVPEDADPAVCTATFQVTDFTRISSEIVSAAVEVVKFNEPPFIDLDLGLTGRDYSTQYFQGGSIVHIVSIYDPNLYNGSINVGDTTVIGEAEALGEAMYESFDDGTTAHGVVIEEQSHAGYTLIDIDSPELDYLQVEFAFASAPENDVIQYPCLPLPQDEKGCTSIGESDSFAATSCSSDVFGACNAEFDLCSDLQITVFCAAVGRKAYRFEYRDNKTVIRYERLLGYLGYEYLLKQGGMVNQIRILNVTTFDGESVNPTAITRVKIRNQDVLIIVVDPPPPGITFRVYEDERPVRPTPYSLLLYIVSVIRVDGTIPDYSIVEFNITGGNDDGAFAIDQLGQITLAGELDRETIDRYALTVTAHIIGSDPGTTASEEVIVGILDVNDNIPQVADSFFVNVTEGGRGGQFVVDVAATDEDIDENAELNYILLGIGAEYFQVDMEGVVTTRVPLNITNCSDYFLLVMIICDRGEPRLCTHTVINIYLVIRSSTILFFDPLLPEITIFESFTSTTTPIGQVHAEESGGETDPHLVRYQIIGLEPEEVPDAFRLDEITGEIFVNTVLSAERTTIYFLQVEAFSIRSNPPPPAPANMTTVINIQDVNEFPPMFVDAPYTYEVAENSNQSTLVGTLRAVDSDAMDMGNFIYFIRSAPDNLPFIVQQDGDVLVSGDIDYEQDQTFAFVVQAVDDPAHSMPRMSATAEVTVVVLDQNDNAPIFINTPYIQEARETDRELANGGTFILNFDTTDADSVPNQDVFYTVTGIDGTPFCVVGQSIQICNATQLTEIEQERVFTFEIVAVNPPGQGSTRTQTNRTDAVITLVLINEFPPTFTPPDILHEGLFEEHCNTGVGGNCTGVVVYDFRALSATGDLDGGINGEFSLQLLTSGVPFALDSATGLLTVTGRLDRDGGIDFYSLEIQAVDSPDVDGTIFNATAIINVPVYDIDDTAPVLLPPFNFSATENMTETREVIGQIGVFDPDINGTRTYYILVPDDPPESEGCFRTSDYLDPEFTPIQIDTFTGELFFCVPIDFENDRRVYEFTVGVIDQGRLDVGTGIDKIATYRVEMDYSVTIVDSNDHPPSFSQDSYVFLHPENSPVGSEVHRNSSGVDQSMRITATDPDSGLNGLLRYSVNYNGNTSCSADLPFQIEELTGVLRTCLPLDYEFVRTYSFSVMVCDGAPRPLCDTAVVIVDIADRNDNPPVFRPSLYSATIAESDTFVVTIEVQDVDSVPNGQSQFDIITVSPSGPFGLRDPTPYTVELYVTDPSQIDYDFGPRGYLLYVEATNFPEDPFDVIQYANTTVTVMITDVNDNAPQIFPPLVFQVRENEPVLSPVGCINATDADSEQNAELEYYLGTGSVCPAEAPFTINTTTGCITTCQDIDYEVQQRYEFQVSVCDQGIPVLCTNETITVNVVDLNDNAPVYEEDPFIVEINENSMVGESVLLVNSTDADSPPNSDIIFSFFNTTAPFDLRNNNEIYYSGPEELDYEGVFQSYILNLRGTNPPGPTGGDQTFTVDVAITINIVDRNDQPPIFEREFDNITINEHSAIGTVIYVLNTTDADTEPNSQVRYVIGNFLVDFTTSNEVPFKIVGNEIRVADNTTIDFETLDFEYALEIIAINEPPSTSLDDETQTANFTLTVDLRDINDNRPECLGPFAVEVPEDSGPITNVTVRAQDADSGLNGFIYYQIQADGDPLCLLVTPFDIDPDSGELYICYPLDFEEIKEYDLNIVVCDRGPRELCAICPLMVTVTDANDNIPVIQPPTEFSINETVGSGYRIDPCLNATDEDTGLNAQLDYHIIGTECTPDIPFEIVTTGGLGCIDVCYGLDFENYTEYVFDVNVTDSGVPVLWNTATITVTVVNENDHTPFITSPDNAEVHEGAVAAFFNVSGADRDAAPYNSITFSLVDNDGGRFSINSSSGALSTAVELDRETQDSHSIVVRVSDGELSSTQGMTIRVLDINDNPPTYQGLPSYTFPEEILPLEQAVVFTDADIGINANLTYEVTDPRFDIDRFGILRNLVPFDRDNGTSNVTVAVIARDGGIPTMSGEAQITIVFSDLNDNDPELLPPFQYSIIDGSREGEFIFQAVALDTDEGDNAKLVFSIFGGRDADLFNITDDGVVRLTQDIFLDLLPYDILMVTIEVRDSGIPQLRDSATYNISVISEVPFFPEDQYNCFIRENGLNMIVNCTPEIVAMDRDRSPFNDIFEYSIRNITPYNTGFRIENSGAVGNIYTPADYFDYEDVMVFDLVIGVARENVTEEVDDTARVILTVIEQNDNPPRLSPQNLTGELPETAPNGYTVVTAVAIDFDLGLSGQITYILSGDGSDFFAFDSDGNLLVANATLVDYETNMNFSFIYQACDGRGLCSVEGYIFIEVINVDDLPPVFDPDEYSAAISEDYGLNRIILHVFYTDGDTPPDQVELSLSPPQTLFQIVQISGALMTTNIPLDRETRAYHGFSVIATDIQGNQDVANVFIDVLDVNDIRPRVEPAESAVTFLEGVGTAFVAETLSIFDEDNLSVFPLTTVEVSLYPSLTDNAPFPPEGGICDHSNFSILYDRNAYAMCGISNCQYLFNEEDLVITNGALSGGILELFDNSLARNRPDRPQVLFSGEDFEEFTLSFWTLLSGGSGNILEAQSDFGLFAIEVSPAGGDNGVLRVLVNSTTSILTSMQVPVYDSRWHQSALTRINNSLILYFDSEEVGRIESAEPFQTARFVDGTFFFGNRLSGYFSEAYFCRYPVESADVRCTFTCGESFAVSYSTPNVTATVSLRTRSVELEYTGSNHSESLTSLQEALRSIVYYNTLDEPHPLARSVRIRVFDRIGPSDQYAVVALSPILINDKRPVLDLNGIENDGIDLLTTFSEQSEGALIVDAASRLYDEDSGFWTVNRVEIELLDPSPLEFLSTIVTEIPDGFSVYTLNSGSQIIINSTNPAEERFPGEFLDALRAVQYVDVEEEPITVNRTLVFTVYDNGALNVNDPKSVTTVTVVPTNDPPVLDLDTTSDETLDTSVVFFEEDGFVKLISGNTHRITDPDSVRIAGAIITLTKRPDGEFESLRVDTNALPSQVQSMGLTVNFTSEDSTLTINGTFDHAIWEDILRTVEYVNDNRDPDSSPEREVSMQVVDDGGAISEPARVSISLVLFNHPPEIYTGGPGLVNFATNFTEDGPCIPVVSDNITIIEHDSRGLFRVEVRLQDYQSDVEESIIFPGDPADYPRTTLILGNTRIILIFGSGDPDDSPESYARYLRMIVYCNFIEEPSPTPRRISFVATDSDFGRSDTAFTTINVINVNDRPVLGFEPINNISVRNVPTEIIDDNSISVTDNDDILFDKLFIFITNAANGFDNEIIEFGRRLPENTTSIGPMVNADGEVFYEVTFRGAGANGTRVIEAISAIRYNNRADDIIVDPPRNICLILSDFKIFSFRLCVNVTISPPNDFNPVFTNDPASLVYTYEETNTPITIVQLQATDDDTGLEGQLQYSIREVISTTPSGSTESSLDVFEISSSGVLTAPAGVDAEQYTAHTVTVVASDMGNPILSAAIDVRITVLDINDVLPGFSQAVYTSIDQREELPPPRSIISVSATDGDITFPNNVVARYELVDAGPSFTINPATGLIQYIALLDADEQEMYILNVSAVDAGNPPLTGYATVNFTLIDINDNAAELQQLTTSLHVVGGTPRSIAPAIRIVDEDLIGSSITEVEISLTPNDADVNRDYITCLSQCQEERLANVNLLNDAIDLLDAATLISDNNHPDAFSNVVIGDASCPAVQLQRIGDDRGDDGYGRITRSTLPSNFGAGEFSISFVATIRNEGFIFIVPTSSNLNDPTSVVDREFALWVRARDIRFDYVYSSGVRDRVVYDLRNDDNAPFEFFFLSANAAGGPQFTTRHYTIVSREGDDSMGALDIYVDCERVATLQLEGVPVAPDDFDVFIGQSRPPPVNSGRLGADIHGLYYHNTPLNASQIQTICCGVEEMRLPKPLPPTVRATVEDPLSIVLVPTVDRIPEEDALSVLRSITYVNTYDPPTLEPDRRLDFVVREAGLPTMPGETVGFIKLVESDSSLPFVDLNGVAVQGIDYAAEFAEDGNPVAVVSSAVRVDREITGGFVLPTFDRIVIELTNAIDPSEALRATASEHITVSSSEDRHAVNITGPGIESDFIPVLLSLAYENGVDRPTTSVDRIIEFTVIDTEGRTNSPRSFTTISITAINDEPELSLSATPGHLYDSIIFEEGDIDGVSVAPNAVIQDVDDDDLTGMTVRLESPNLADDQLVLEIGFPAISSSYSRATGVLQLTGTAALSDYQALLRSVRFQSQDSPFLDNDGEPVSDPNRFVYITVADSNLPGGNGTEAVVEIEFRPLDDPPVIGLVSTELNFTDGSPPLPIAAGATITDADNQRLSSMTISLVNSVPLENDALMYQAETDTVWSFDEDLLTNYIDILQSISYVNNAEEPSLLEPPRTVEVEVCDFGPIDDCARAEITIFIQDSNDNPPSFTMNTYTFSIAENRDEAPVGILTVVDQDQLDQNFVFSQSDTSLPFRLEQSSNPEAVIVTTQPLDFESTENYTFTVIVNDGLNTGMATVTIDVDNVNEAPIINSSEIVSTVVGRPSDATTLLQGGVLSITDPDNGDTISKAILTVTGIPEDSEESLALFANISGYSFSQPDPSVNTYSLTVNQSTASFAEALSGIVYVAGTRLTDLLNFRRVSISVFDQDGLESSNQVIVDVSLASIPEFIGTPYNVSLVEGIVRENFFQVQAVVESGGPTIVYDVEPGNNVVIDPDTGELSLTSPLDHESETTIDFDVFAIDNLAPARTGTTTVTITVLDSNDVRPEIDGVDDVIVNITRAVPVLILPSVTITDPDITSSIEYATITVSGVRPLQVSPFTGDTCENEYNVITKMDEVCGLQSFVDLLANTGTRVGNTISMDSHGNRILSNIEGVGYTEITADFSDFEGILNGFTFLAWLRPEASGYIAYFGVSDGTERYFALYYREDVNQLIVTFKRAGLSGLAAQVRISFQLEQPLNDGNWHFTMLQYSSRDLFLAVDGRLMSSVAVVYKEEPFIGQVFGRYPDSKKHATRTKESIVLYCEVLFAGVFSWGQMS